MRNNKRGDEIFIPLNITQSGYVQEGTILFVVVLTSPPRDPIRAPKQALPPRVSQVQHNNDSSSSVQRDVVE
jgi:hypothetical protein